MAMHESSSYVDDDGAEGWEEWVDGFASFCGGLVEDERIFSRLADRIYAGDQLRKAELHDRMQLLSLAKTGAVPDDAVGTAPHAKRTAVTDAKGRQWSPARNVKELLGLDNEEFICSSYVTLFNRLPDSDGLVNYLTELQAGVSKIEVITRLRRSSEGRQWGASLAGYRSKELKMRLRSLLGFIG
jgi:hypothetical protein